jgi:hypothetical protein
MRWRRRVKVQVASILSIDQAAELAHAWYARKLAPDWRRHTPDEAEALFARLGLERDFWRLH